MKKMNLRFWIKTLLHKITPGGFGYNRKLKNFRDPDYNHELHKHQVRQKHHGSGGWKETPHGKFHYRDYADYEEYVTHQKQKWDEMLKAKGGLSGGEIASFRIKFFRRFAYVSRLLSSDAAVLCAGARQGTEVEVFRDLGFRNAVGIDLNPGPDNPYVVPGDFMHLDAADSSLDLIYCNAVDHAFQLEKFFAEHARAIHPRGYALYDIAIQEGGAFEAVEWSHEEALFSLILKYFDKVIKVETEQKWKWILVQGPRKDALSD